MPTKVILFCPMLDFKNKPAMLMTISPHGYYECRVDWRRATTPCTCRSPERPWSSRSPT